MLLKGFSIRAVTHTDFVVIRDNFCIFQPPSMTSSTMEDPYSPSGYAYSPRGGPPPIPSVPPVSSTV